MSALSALFPNLAHLRLDQNHRAVELSTLKRYTYRNQPNCSQCVQQVWDDYLRRNPKAKQGQQFYGLLDVEAGNVQLLPSSTAPVCKAALVRRAVAAWPKLASITLQIDDFFRAAYRKRAYNGGAASVSRLQYLYRCENLLLRDQVTGEPLQEEDHKWTVQEVLY